MSGTPDETLRRLLLGRLPEAEAERLEERILSEDDCAERLREIEDDLFDDYAAGRLSSEDRAAVEQCLLTSNLGHERLHFAYSLAEIARDQGDSGAASEPHVSRDRPSSSHARKWLAPIGVLLAAGVAYFFVLPPRLSQPPAPHIAQPGGDPNAAPSSAESTATEGTPAPTAPFTLVLLADQQRGAGRARRVAIPSGVEHVRLQLEVDDGPSASPDTPTYRVAVRPAQGPEVFVSAPLVARQVGAYRIVETLVPVQALGTGDRRVSLSRAHDPRDQPPLLTWSIDLHAER